MYQRLRSLMIIAWSILLNTLISRANLVIVIEAFIHWCLFLLLLLLLLSLLIHVALIAVGWRDSTANCLCAALVLVRQLIDIMSRGTILLPMQIATSRSGRWTLFSQVQLLLLVRAVLILHEVFLVSSLIISRLLLRRSKVLQQIWKHKGSRGLVICVLKLIVLRYNLRLKMLPRMAYCIARHNMCSLLPGIFNHQWALARLVVVQSIAARWTLHTLPNGGIVSFVGGELRGQIWSLLLGLVLLSLVISLIRCHIIFHTLFLGELSL